MSQNNDILELPTTELKFGQVNILQFDHIEIMRVADDPTTNTPFQIGYSKFSKKQAAAIAAAIIEVLTQGDLPEGDYHALASARDMLTSFAKRPTMPF